MATATGGTQPPVEARPAPGDVSPPTFASLEQRLFTAAYRFNFFQAVRLLERLDPERRPVGGDATPLAEAARFRAYNTLSFPASMIHRLERPTPDVPIPVMTVSFMGLTGPSGVLPRHYTEQVLRSMRDPKDEERYVLRDWLDLFNHRFVSLFYRAGTKYRFWNAYERREHQDRTPDPFTLALLSLVGLGFPSLRNRLRVSSWEEVGGRGHERVLARVDDLALLHYGGLLAHRPRCAESLGAILEDYFQVPVRVQEFQGQWLQLDPAIQSRLGGGEEANSELGHNAMAGSQVWDQQSKIRLRLGPLSYARFLAFLPDRTPVPERKQFFVLLHLARFYVGPEFDLDVQVVLKGGEVPECRLVPSAADGPQLGWNTWITSKPLEVDCGDAVFAGEEIVWVNGRPASVPRR